ncbi:MAG TPA: DUF4397 domain-containing protein [Burkholderiaceae bacterium]|nr:DUF4397 domain-containing protein [Burkholderiaceae bacterium]
MRTLLCAVGAVVVSLLTACGSSNNNTTPANMRTVNTTSTPITTTLNGGYPLVGIASDTASGYASIPPGTYTISVSSVNGSLNPSSQTVALGTAENYTTIAFQRGNSAYTTTITDDLSIPAVGYTTLDVANASPDAGALDVYLLPPGTTSLSPGDSPNFAAVQGTQSPPATFTTGSYNIIVTGAGNQGDVRLSIIGANGAGAVSFTSQQVANLALTDTPGGTLVDGFVITQGAGGGVVPYPNTMARVRLISAVTTSSPPPTVGLTTAGGTAISVAAPNSSGYKLVSGGDSVATMTVGGAAITAPAGTFVAGNDYTVMAYTSGGTNVATILTDNNQIRAVSASVRVINGSVSPADGITVYYGGVPIANQVQLGAASAYYGVQPSSSAVLSANGSGYSYAGAQPAFDPPVGSVWSIFVYSNSSVVQLFRDR